MDERTLKAYLRQLEDRIRYLERETAGIPARWNSGGAGGDLIPVTVAKDGGTDQVPGTSPVQYIRATYTYTVKDESNNVLGEAVKVESARLFAMATNPATRGLARYSKTELVLVWVDETYGVDTSCN